MANLELWSDFVRLIRTPFQHEALVWGIVPLYFGWIINELTSAKASFNTAIQTGFALLWAGAQWSWQSFRDDPMKVVRLNDGGLFAVNTAVTLAVLALGGLALWSGLRRRYPRGMTFLGHTRFSAYFMIAIFPIQAGYLAWKWSFVWAIALFAVPIWLAFHLVLKLVR